MWPRGRFQADHVKTTKCGLLEKSAKGKHFVQRANKNLNHSFSKRFLQPTYCYAAFGYLSITRSRDTFGQLPLAFCPSLGLGHRRGGRRKTDSASQTGPFSERDARGTRSHCAGQIAAAEKTISRMEDGVQEDGVGVMNSHSFMSAWAGNRKPSDAWRKHSARMTSGLFTWKWISVSIPNLPILASTNASRRPAPLNRE